MEIYKSKFCSDTADALYYYCQFSTISQNLIAKKKLNTFTQSWWFIEELPSHLQNKIFYQWKLDSDDDVNIDFEDQLKKVMELLVAKKKLASLV